MIPLQKPMSKLLIAALFLFGVTSCVSVPRIIILHDPLSAKEHFQLGGVYESHREWDSAISEYRATLKKEAMFPGVAFRLGNAYYHKKDYAAAEKSYRSALRSDAEYAPLLNNLASLYLAQRKSLKEAEDLIQKAIKLDPPRRFVYLDTLGSIYLAQGDYLAALESYAVAEGLIPENSPLKSQLSAHHKGAAALLKKTSRAPKIAREFK